jgi:hypothetical protein
MSQAKLHNRKALPATRLYDVACSKSLTATSQAQLVDVTSLLCLIVPSLQLEPQLPMLCS